MGNFFKDERLKALIPIALENNRDLRIAVQRVEEARALYGIQRSDQFPQIGVNAQQTAQRMPEDMRAGGALAPSVSRSNVAGIGMTNFELDFLVDKEVYLKRPLNNTWQRNRPAPPFKSI